MNQEKKPTIRTPKDVLLIKDRLNPLLLSLGVVSVAGGGSGGTGALDQARTSP